MHSKKLQASRQTLTDLDSEQILSSQNKSEYKTLLETRLGLNFEQFTRAVMLAQSEFSAFLKADDKERSELLEKLTDTAIYSQLGARLRQEQGSRRGVENPQRPGRQHHPAGSPNSGPSWNYVLPTPSNN